MRGLTASERRDLILSVGTHRGTRRLSPLEVAELLGKAVAHGSSRRDCSAALGVGTSQIATFLKLLALTPQVRHLAGWGGASLASVPFSSLAELGRLSPPEQISAAEAILEEQLTWKEVIEVIQIADRARKGVTECVADVVRRRPSIEKRHVLVGRVESDTERRLRELNQGERDDLLRDALASIVDPDCPFDARLGFEAFTVVTSEDILWPLRMDADQFEEVVNTRIREMQGFRGLSD